MILLKKGMVLDGRYEIVERCSTGGQSAGYKARISGGRGKKMVFIKQYADLYEEQLDEQKAFYSELHSRLGNDRSRFCLPLSLSGQGAYVPAVGCSGDGFIYTAFPLLEGLTLKSLLEKYSLDQFQKRRLIRTILSICIQLEKKGIAHLDIKPDNFIVKDYGSKRPFITLIDMDYARMRELDDPGSSYDGIRDLGGTEWYKAPEVAEGRKREVSSQADSYSLGMLLVDMLMDGEDFRLSMQEEKDLWEGRYVLQNPDIHPAVLGALRACFLKDVKTRMSVNKLGLIMQKYAGTFFARKKCGIAFKGMDSGREPYYFWESHDIRGEDLIPLVRQLPGEASLRLNIDQNRGDYSIVPLRDDIPLTKSGKTLKTGHERFLEIPDPDGNMPGSLYELNKNSVYIYLEEE